MNNPVRTRTLVRFRRASRWLVAALIPPMVLACGKTEEGGGGNGMTGPPPSPIFERSFFATVPGLVGVHFGAAGNLFTGNVENTQQARVRRVTPAGTVTEFGDPVWDPDALIVDTGGAFSTLGPGSVLTGGGTLAGDIHHIMEISSDGSVTQPLIEIDSPELKNPSAFTFLPNGDMLISNFENNTISRLSKDGSGTLQLSPFYAETDASDAMFSIQFLDGTVYVVTGASRLTALSPDGQTLDEDLWPASETETPTWLAVATAGDLAGLLVGSSDGRIRVMDTSSNSFSLLGDLVFDNIFGLGVSPTDLTLYVAERGGSIWQVRCTNCDG